MDSDSGYGGGISKAVQAGELVAIPERSEVKTCSFCKTAKPIHVFYIKGQYADGRVRYDNKCCGQAFDSVEILRKAIAYLQEHNGT